MVTTIAEVHITTKVTVKTRTLSIKQTTRKNENIHSQNSAYAGELKYTKAGHLIPNINEDGIVRSMNDILTELKTEQTVANKFQLKF